MEKLYVVREALKAVRYLLCLLLPLDVFGQKDFIFALEEMDQMTHHCYIQDHLGFIWAGSESGLKRYGGNISLSFDTGSDSNALPNDYVLAIAEGLPGEIWVGTRARGLWLMDTKSYSARPVNSSNSATALSDLQISSLQWTPKGLFVGTVNGLSWLEDKDAGIFQNYLKGMHIFALEMVDDNTLLAGTNRGIYSVSLTDRHIVPFPGPELQQGDSLPEVNALHLDHMGTIWAGIAGKGLFRMTSSQRWERIGACPFRQFNDLQTGLGNYLWVAGIEGPGYLELTTNKWTFLDTLHRIKSYAFGKDRNGNLYHGCDGVVTKISPYSPGVVWYDNLFPNKSVLNRAQFLDKQNRLWLGFSDRVIVVEPAPRPGETRSRRVDIPGLRDIKGAISLHEAPGDKIWIGTQEQGLARFDGKKIKIFQELNRSNPEFAKNAIVQVLTDKTGRLWTGSWGGQSRGAGLFEILLSPDAEPEALKQYKHNPEDPKSLPCNAIRCLFEDSKGRIWVGMQGGGFSLFHKAEGTFSNYLGTLKSADDELPHTIMEIAEDPLSHKLWLATDNGLTEFDPDTKEHKVYNRKSGLPLDRVLDLHLDASGNLWLFPGEGSFVMWSNDRRQVYSFDSKSTEGACGHCSFMDREGWYYTQLAVFHPDSLRYDLPPPRVLLTEVRLFGKEVLPQADGKGIIPVTAPYLTALRFRHDQSVIGLGFAALGEGDADYYRYAYRLRGSSGGDTWTEVEKGQQNLTFNGLAPGHYTLEIRASNPYGIWPDEGQSWPLVILPPWYQRWWAWMIYALAFTGVVVLVFRVREKRRRLEQSLALEQIERNKAREVEQVKSRFFANVSHEFRTPLTLIREPVNRILRDPQTPAEQRLLLERVARAARRLHELINQLLDIARLEAGQLQLKPSGQYVARHLSYVFSAFDSLAESRNIHYRVELPEEATAWYDSEKWVTVLNNLLSNAFKFTPEGGSVQVRAEWKTTPESGRLLEILVADTGPGIPEEEAGRIFQRFYQVDGGYARQYEGSGIGLALSKELVEFMGGSLRLLREPERQGASFLLQLPAPPLPEGESVQDLTAPEETAALPAALPVPQTAPEHAPLLLIVEDNRDMRAHIRELFEGQYRIREASNGLEGLDAARGQEELPDMVISDVMMPKMDGYTLCEHLKQDSLTSHIPVVLLTAKASVESKVEGYGSGAEAHLAKPFDDRELQALVASLLEQRRNLQERYAKEPRRLDPEAMDISGPDRHFLQRIDAALEAGFADTKFNVGMLAQEVAMSREHLSKKFKALRGKSISEYLQLFRLLKSKEMLLKPENFTIADIAMRCGFESPSHFAKVFKEQFGILPSDYMAKGGE